MWKLETVKQVVQHWDQKKKIKMQGMQKNEKKKKNQQQNPTTPLLVFHFHGM